MGGVLAREMGLGRARLRVRLWVRPAPLVGQGGRAGGRFPRAGWRRRSALWRCSRGRGRVVGDGGVQLGRGWRERQGRGRLASAGLGGGKPLQRAPQALINVIQVDVIQVSRGQMEATWEAPHLGLGGG